ncbi:MAG: pyridoxamine 5'-phosphate oxidase family protein [Sedimentitalea sp.]
MNDTASDLAATWAQAWDLMQTGVRDARHAARRVVLASVDARGAPQQRMVAMRRADAPQADIDIHTDLLSTKIGEYQANPAACVLVWDPETQVQLRLNGTISIASGAQTAHQWPDMPQRVRENYGHRPTPGQPIATSDGWENVPHPDRFAVLTLHLDHMDHVCLDPNGHRRARFERHTDWRGVWLSP